MARRDVIVESTPIVPLHEYSGRVPELALADRIDERRDPRRSVPAPTADVIGIIADGRDPSKAGELAGAEAVVLLHLVSKVDKATPVVFVDTEQHFPETLGYRDRLVERFGLTNLVVAKPDAEILAAEDPEKFLFASDPDRCCEIRKVAPLAATLQAYEAWITGRKGFQTADRATLPLFEAEGARVKVNPLVGWTATDLLDYIKQHDLPPHPLTAKGFPSIGCLPCTSPVRPGEEARAGRWRGRGKTECGIHVGALNAGGDI